MISRYYFKPRLWPTVMTILMLAVLCILGNWQIERLEWKLGLIEKLETRYSLPSIALPDTASDPDDWEYRHVSISGRFLHMREMPLYGIGPDGRPGYDLFTPLVTLAGNHVIINRGWVPEKLKEQISRPETLTSGVAHLTGVLRKDMKKQRFTPKNDPDLNLWYYGNLQAMAKAQDLSQVFPMFLYVDKDTSKGEYPVGGRTRLKLVNNHLDYALTWFGLAIVLMVIYIIFSLHKAGRPEDHF